MISLQSYLGPNLHNHSDPSSNFYILLEGHINIWQPLKGAELSYLLSLAQEEIENSTTKSVQTKDLKSKIMA